MPECFLPIPHLPAGIVTCAAVSAVRPSVVRALQDHGVRVLPVEPLDGIDGAERFHADMALCAVNGAVWWTARQLSPATKTLLRKEGCVLTDTQQPVTAQCPSLNVCIAGHNVLGCPKTVDPLLRETLGIGDRQWLTVRQRYTKCSVAIVCDRAVITADVGIEKVCRSAGIDVLLIRSGSIVLDGYAYGFIGGCCGLLAPDCLAFSGRIERHPDYPDMRDFARSYGVSLLSLTEEPLYDVGGILPVKESVTAAELS